VVEGEPGRVRIRGVERRVALLGHVQLRPQDETKALQRAEPRAEAVLAEGLVVGSPLELGERQELPLEEAGSDEPRVLGVRLVVVDVGRREQPVEGRLAGREGVAQLAGKRGEHVALLRRQADRVRAVSPWLDAAAHV
jgi:hypothetical protein